MAINQSGNVLVAGAALSYQWVVCPSMTPIIGATDQSYTATENGQYAVITTNNLGCVDTSACYSVTGLSVVNSGFKNELRVHPNPTEGNFYISLGENRSAASVTVSDLRGRAFHSELFNNGPLLNLKLDAPAGLYLLRIESGSEYAVIRLVKE